MARYSAQFRNTILRKLLPPENRSARELAQEYGLTVATIYGWKAQLKRGTLGRDEGEMSNRQGSLAEKFNLLLEAQKVSEEQKGSWLRENALTFGAPHGMGTGGTGVYGEG